MTLVVSWWVPNMTFLWCKCSWRRGAQDHALHLGTTEHFWKNATFGLSTTRISYFLTQAWMCAILLLGPGSVCTRIFTHTTNIPGTCLLIADSQFASRLYNCVPRRTWNTWHSFVNNILSPSKKTCLNLVPQMDVSSTNLILDASIRGTSFFGWREYLLLR